MRYEKSEPGIIQYKLSHKDEDEFKKLNINARRTNAIEVDLKRAYSNNLPVSLNKKQDLIEMLPFIKPEFHSFYQNIRCNEEECAVENDSDLGDDESS